MKTYRYLLVLMVIAVLVIPQPAPVNSAPLNARNTLDLKPGDTVIVTCSTRLVRKSASPKNWELFCRPRNGANNNAESSTQTPVPTPTEPNIIFAAIFPRDTLTINCPTRLIPVPNSESQTGRALLCRALADSPTATPQPSPTVLPTLTFTASVTQPPAPTNTQPVQPTVTQPSVPTGTVMAVPTQTSLPTATWTATPSITVSPTATATISIGGGLIQPFKGAPLCPSHDVNTWHPLWDYQRGCHYDHTHGDDPVLADKYFGKLGVYWGGATISYPFSSGPSENAFKHAGYKVSVRMPGYHSWPPCGTEDNTDITGDHSDNCVIASRTEYHLLGSLADLAHRYHSYWMEVYICKPPYRQPQDCGIMRTGGLLDYGQLQAPHYNARVVRPGGTIDFGNGMTMNYMADGPDLPSHSGEPYVFSIPYSAAELESYRNNPPKATLTQAGKATIDQWSSNDFDCEPRPAGDPCHNQYTHVLFQVGDSFNLVDTQNLNTVRWICWGEPDCEYNGSMIGMNEIAVRILQSWQTSGGGWVTFNGYSDKWGNPRFDNTCTSISADCVPFILEHAPVGVAASRSDNLCECQVWEYDTYFNGKPSGWIKFPN